MAVVGSVGEGCVLDGAWRKSWTDLHCSCWTRAGCPLFWSVTSMCNGPKKKTHHKTKRPNQLKNPHLVCYGVCPEGSARLQTSFPLQISLKGQPGKEKMRINNLVMLGMGFACSWGSSLCSKFHLWMLMMLWFPPEFLGHVSAPASRCWAWASVWPCWGGRAWPHRPCFAGAYFSERCWVCFNIDVWESGYWPLLGRVINLIPAASFPGFNK